MVRHMSDTSLSMSSEFRFWNGPEINPHILWNMISLLDLWRSYEKYKGSNVYQCVLCLSRQFTEFREFNVLIQIRIT